MVQELGEFSMCDCLRLDIPGTNQYIRPGNKIKLGRFSSILWIADHGWFEFDGNRPFCGWHLSNSETGQVKPLLKTDLDDVYLIE